LEIVPSDRGEVSSSLSLSLARSWLVTLQVERQWTARQGPELTGDALLLPGGFWWHACRMRMRNPAQIAAVVGALLLFCLATAPVVDAREPCNTCVCHGPVEKYVAPPCTPSCSLLRKS
jgi:hypothetical protein